MSLFESDAERSPYIRTCDTNYFVFFFSFSCMYFLPCTYLGICSEVEDGAPMIILELMEFGDLKNFLIQHGYVYTMSMCDAHCSPIIAALHTYSTCM